MAVLKRSSKHFFTIVFLPYYFFYEFGTKIKSHENLNNNYFVKRILVSHTISPLSEEIQPLPIKTTLKTPLLFVYFSRSGVLEFESERPVLLCNGFSSLL